MRAMPSAPSPVAHTTAAATSITSRGPGQPGAHRRRVNSSATTARPSPSVGRWTAPNWETSETVSCHGVLPEISRPVSLEYWLTIIRIAMPAMYPVSTGEESRLARKPSRARKPTRQTSPTASASSAATSARRDTPTSPTSAAMPAAVISAVVDSGPIESCRDEPSKAYTASGASVAHSPVTAGSPTISA